MNVTVRKIDGELVVTIPRDVAAKTAVAEGTPLSIDVTPSGITLKKAGSRRRRPLNELIAEMDRAAYRKHNREFSGDAPVGREIW